MKNQTEEFSVYDYTLSYNEFFEDMFKLNIQDIKIKTRIGRLKEKFRASVRIS